jgi:hypothetical protein
VNLFYALSSSAHPARLQSFLIDNPRVSSLKLEQSLEWSFSTAPWELLPIPVLDKLCDYLSLKDILALTHACSSFRKQLFRINDVAAVLDFWLSEQRRRQENHLVYVQVKQGEARARAAKERADFLFLLLLIVVGLFLVFSQVLDCKGRAITSN